MLTTVLIEDDPRIARLLFLELGRAGWTVICAKTGQAGLEALDVAWCDLVILDLMLPDTDGISVCRAMREVSAVPILILTARDAVEDRVKGLDAGADDYLVKPFATVELLARMRALTRRRGMPDPRDDWLVAGTLELSARRHEFRVGGAMVPLTRREFALIEYLMENAGITLTRDMILDRVWGWGYSGAASIVDVYVGYLRRKVERPEATGHILTVRGIGYQLAVDEGR